MRIAIMTVCMIGSMVTLRAERIILDEILAVLPHPDGDIVMLSSDIALSIGGEQRSFRSIIVDGLMVLEARNLKLNAPEAAIDSVIAGIQKQNHCSYAELLEQFERAGFSGSEMRDIIKQRRLVEQLMSIVVRIAEPSKEEIAAYATEHGIITPEQYEIRLGYIPQECIDAETRSALEQEGRVPDETIWYEPERYEKDSLSPEQQAITTIPIGGILILEAQDDGYDIVQLVAHIPESRTPLEESRALYEIKEERYLKALEDFQEKLLEKGTIRFCKDESFLRELLKQPDSAAEEYSV